MRYFDADMIEREVIGQNLQDQRDNKASEGHGSFGNYHSGTCGVRASNRETVGNTISNTGEQKQTEEIGK